MARAAAELGRGETAAAEAILHRALAAGEDRADAEHLLAAVLAARGAEREAWALLGPPAERERDLRGYRELIERLPGLALLEAQAARVALELGATGAAECLARRALTASPEEGRLHHLMASIELAAGRSEEAAASCRRALELGDRRGVVWATLGRAELALLRFEAAAAAYRRALRLDAALVDGIPPAGLAQLAANGDDLRGDLERHLGSHGGCTRALYALGLVARREGDLEAATGFFERLAALDPDNSATRYALAQLHLQGGREARGKEEMEVFRRLKAAEDAEWERQNGAFRRRLEARELAPQRPLYALRIYRDLASENLATVEDYVEAGRALVAMGELESARAWFKGVLDRRPFHPEALEGLAGAAAGGQPTPEIELARRRRELVSWACR